MMRHEDKWYYARAKETSAGFITFPDGRQVEIFDAPYTPRERFLLTLPNGYERVVRLNEPRDSTVIGTTARGRVTEAYRRFPRQPRPYR